MPRYYQDAQDASVVQPTNPTDATGAPLGLLLADMRGFRLTVQCEEESTTLDGTGTMRCVLWHPVLAAWFRDPDLDFEVGADVSGERGRTFPDVETAVPDGARVYYYRDGVGLSVAGNLTVRLDAIARRP